MATIIKKRTIRPSTRNPKSRYRVRVNKVTPSDTVRIEIDHEAEPFEAVFEIPGQELGGRDSIYFNANKSGSNWNIIWANVNPIKIQ